MQPLRRPPSSTPSTIRRLGKIQCCKMTLPSDFKKKTIQGNFSSEFWELFKPLHGSKLGWLSNSVVQTLPKGSVFKKGLCRLSESIFFSLVVLLYYYSALHCNPRACPAFSPQLASLARLGEDHTATRRTWYCFISSALSPRVQQSPCGDSTLGLPLPPPACFPPSDTAGLGMRGMVAEQQSPLLAPQWVFERPGSLLEKLFQWGQCWGQLRERELSRSLHLIARHQWPQHHRPSRVPGTETYCL